MSVSLGIIDYLVVAAYLIGTLAIGLVIGRRLTSGQDYFLAGRQLPWWAVGMSLVATDIGGTDILGAGGAAYSYGIAVANFEWIGCVPAMIVAAFIFVPHFWRIGIYTIPEFMERRFSPAMRVALAVCWLLFMASNIGVMLFASAKMVYVALGFDLSGWSIMGFHLHGFEIPMGIIAVALITGLYTMSGGLAAVVYTDVLQCAVMIAGCLAVVVIGILEVGGPGELIERVAAVEQMKQPDADGMVEHLELVLPVETKSPFPWTGIFFGLALILSPAYWIGNQAIIQRSLGARSAFQAQASYVWGALLKNIVPIIIAVPGLIAFALYPNLEEGDHAFPMLVKNNLPAGMPGVFLAAFLAALMSSVDSYLNSASTIFVNDVYLRFLVRQKNDKQALRAGRLTTLVLMVWGILFGLWCTRLEEGIYGLFQTLMSFFQGPALAALMFGLFWWRANAVGALAGFLAGLGTTITLFTLNQPAIYTALEWLPLYQIQQPFLYYSIWGFLVSVIVTALVSLVTAPPDRDRILPLMYHRRRLSK